VLTLIGQVATHRGHACQYDRAGDPDPFVMRADQYLRDQPLLPLLMTHDPTWPVGAVGYLQRSRSDGLLAVASVRDDMTDLLDRHDWYLSAGASCHAIGHDEYGSEELGLVKMREISLVPRTANLSTRKVRWSHTDVRTTGGGHPRDLPLSWHDALDGAHEAMSSYKHSLARSLRINDLDELDLRDEVFTDPASAKAMLRADLDAAKAKQRAARPRPGLDDGQRVYRHSYPGTFMRPVVADA
jgi:hypothetical protein